MRRVISLTGISDSRSAYFFSKYMKEERQSLIITSSQKSCQRLSEDLAFFTSKRIYILPEEEGVLLKYQARDHSLLIERLAATKALMEGDECIVLASTNSAMKKLIPHNLISKAKLSLSLSSEMEVGYIREKLVELGYEFTNMVQSRGEFSVRGGIVDVFLADGEHPYRIEFFGTEIDSIRSFDIESQRSIENLNSIDIYPAEQLIRSDEIFKIGRENIFEEYTSYMEKREKLLRAKGESLEPVERLRQRRDELCHFFDTGSNMQLAENYIQYFYSKHEYIWDYMSCGRIYIDDAERVLQSLDSFEKEVKSYMEGLLERGDIIPKDYEIISSKTDFLEGIGSREIVISSPFPKSIKGFEQLSELKNIKCSQMTSFNGHIDFLEEEIRRISKKGFRIVFVLRDKNRIKLIEDLIDRLKLHEHAQIIEGNLSTGFEYIDENLCFISESDIFSTQKKERRKKKKSKGKAIDNFIELKKGDYVVHESYGIGKFVGIKTITVQDDTRDYLHILYHGTEVLYVPVENMDLVQKYIGADGAAPKLSRLSGSDWQVTKAKAKTAIQEMARELLSLYAKRKMKSGYQFPKDDDWQKDFENSFPYVETDDQLSAVEDIKADMENPSAMDRLLCGDVGFGKTEVAARAIFKCLNAGKQAALLVPTTILANQHYYTLKERFEKFPFKVEMLSRFRTKLQQDDIVKKISSGAVDLIIGTHRVLSKDVKFKDLGLLVVDEEQRFGVAHKEAIKQLKENVDVLTLSATPIPRTLNMSLSGIKDMSIIAEPPEDRMPVQTYVMEEDDFVLRDVIERELDRGGQVFVLYNRVKGINKVAERIEELVPQADVIVAHGQMDEHHMEDIMMGFVSGEYNIMVATTIIESGIDIPNANTIIILDCDRFGLSQLYQLRGRVGRSNRMAFAYLMYKKDKVLTEAAEKRLKAIREFTEFGSGFKVAMRDLEIRGAGNFLGSEQSGHMMNIGYELYCKLVDDAVRTMSGEIINEEKNEISVELNINGNIPNWYIDDESTKIHMYKRIASINSVESMEDVIDEMVDRFGDLPKETLNLSKISLVRYYAEEISVSRLYQEGGRIKIEFLPKNPLNSYCAMLIASSFGNRVLIHGGNPPYIKLTSKPSNILDDLIELLKTVYENKDKSLQ